MQMRDETSCRVAVSPSKGILLEALRAAIALIREADGTPEMKVLTVNGNRMQDGDYRLQ